MSNYDDRTGETHVTPKAVTSVELKAEIEAAAKEARESRNTALGAAKEALRKAIVTAARAGETSFNVAYDVLPRSLPRNANETLRVWLAEAGVSARFVDDQHDGSYFELKW